MTEARKNYAKKLKYKKVVFSLKNKDLLDYANKINFNAFVLERLKEAKKGSEKDGQKSTHRRF